MRFILFKKDLIRKKLIFVLVFILFFLSTPFPPAKAVDITTPAAPTNFRATGATDTTITLVWQDNSTDETGFEISGSGGGSVGANTTSYTATGLSRDTSYSYKVRAINSAGHSFYTSSVKAVTLFPAGGPATPTSFTATALSSTQIRLSWQLVGSSTYEIQKLNAPDASPDSYNCVSPTCVHSASSPYTWGSLLAGQKSYFRIRAYNSATVSSQWSPVISATTSYIPPIAPSNLTATITSTNTAHFTWQDNSSDESVFRICYAFRSDLDSSFDCFSGGTVGDIFNLYNAMKDVSAGTTSADYTNAMWGNMSVTFLVTAKKADGSTSSSNKVTIKFPPVTGVTPAAPSKFSAAIASSHRVNFSNPGDVIERSELPTSGFKAIKYSWDPSHDGLEDFATDRTAQPGKTYYYRTLAWPYPGSSGGSDYVTLPGITMPTADSYPYIGYETGDFVLSGQYIYALRAGSSTQNVENFLAVIDISDPSNPHPVAKLTLDKFYDGIAKDGNLVVVTSKTDFKVIDVSTPTAPRLLSTVPVNDEAQRPSLKGQYLYLISRATSSGVHVVDLQNPASPVKVAEIPANTPQRTIIQNNYLYVSTSSDGLLVVDITNPLAHPIVGRIDFVGDGLYPMAINQNYLFLAGASQGVSGFYAVNIQNPASPTVAGMLMQYVIGYSVVTSVAVQSDKVYLAVGSTTDYYFQVHNVPYPYSKTLLGSKTIKESSPRSSAVSGNYAFTSDFRVWNVADPAKPAEIGALDVISKPSVIISADKPQASPGDRLTYTISYKNTSTARTGVKINDIVGSNECYVKNSAKMNGVALTDIADGDIYTFNNTTKETLWNFGNLAADANGSLTYQVTVTYNGKPTCTY